MDCVSAAPPLGPLRLTGIHDVPRIAAVATAGFYYSPVFAWERRFHAEFPQDTFQSYEKMFADAITNPQYIVLVATDTYDPTEDSKTEAIIQPDAPGLIAHPGDTVIVGAATWKLQPGSHRIGQFTPPHEAQPGLRFDGGPGRDKSTRHAELLDDACDIAEDRYAAFSSVLDSVLVHSALMSSFSFSM